MIRCLGRFQRPAAVALAVLSAVSCGGSSTPTTPVAPAPTPTPAAAPTPAPVLGCPIGLGSGRFTCQGDIPGLLPKLNAAIDKLVQDRPQLFNLTDDPGGDGRYRILDVDAFYGGVIDNLTAMGLCAQRDYADRDRIVIKEDNSYSEAYYVVGRQTRILRGPDTYALTCTPANFPLRQDQAVARVSVSFFRYTFCPGGTVLPPPHETLPLGCRGTITATPRDALGNKLPPELHGSEVEWEVRAGEGTIIASGPSPDGIPFNQVLDSRQVGAFTVCATVSNKTGCMNGQVIP